MPSRSESLGRKLETLLLSLLLLGIICLAGSQIVLRNIFSSSIFWADELIRIAILWLAMIGAMAASREGRHIAIGIVPRYFPVSWHRPAAIFAAGFGACISALLAWESCRFVADTYRFGDELLGGLPAWPFQVIMPIGFAVIGWRFAIDVLALLRAAR